MRAATDCVTSTPMADTTMTAPATASKKPSSRTPPANKTPQDKAASATGIMTCVPTAFHVERRQPSKGTRPIKIIRTINKGAVMRLKYGAATVTSTPNTRETSGNTVPQNTAKDRPTKIRLLSTKPNSRDTYDSTMRSSFSKSRRSIIKYRLPAAMRPRKPKKSGPISDSTNVCTEDKIPLRVMNVPKMHKKYVSATKPTFQRFSIPR